ncbi:MAG: thiosulfate oxidation carrier complex protein SoxZ [Hyphomicrobiaceae bacterium]|nr:thiosulfate oxidation carrier complex protein SoxZ [Hyphomicrobiaceae bacterium]
MSKPRIKIVPDTPKAGDVVEVKTLISHVMETGNRKDKDGKPIPRNLINAFKATFGGKEVFSAELQPGISANPYLAFYFKVPASGDLELTWTEDNGTTTTEKIALTAG